MTDQVQIRVLSVDNHPFLREGITAIISDQPDMTLVAEASSGSEGVQKFRELRPDIALMDLRLPDMSGIDSLIAIRTEFSEARIIMLTTFEGDVEIQRPWKRVLAAICSRVCRRGNRWKCFAKSTPGKSACPRRAPPTLWKSCAPAIARKLW
jgi:DNA-binding NarL/FixJ family response regulator